MLLYVLGTSQDGGYPQMGCRNACCEIAWKNSSLRRLPASIAIIDKIKKRYWLIDITPEVKTQIKMLESFDCSLAGIFLTHAHIGHYMGLINLGLEVMNVIDKLNDKIEKLVDTTNDFIEKAVDFLINKIPF